jgi:hypothetical protein
VKSAGFRRFIDAFAILKIVKADAHPRDMAGPIRRSAQAEAWVHLARHALGSGLQSQLDATATGMGFELMNGQQRLSIDVGIGTAAAAALAVGGSLGSIKQVIELGGPVNDKGLTEWHRSPVWPMMRLARGPMGLRGSLVYGFHTCPCVAIDVSKGDAGL